MAIGQIEDREQGLSVRTKLNLAIDDINSLAPITGLARTDSNQIFANDVTVQGAFTSLGIDDNATDERFQIGNSEIVVGGAFAGAYDIVRGIDDRTLIISGGSSSTSGANISLFGSTHSSQANDINIKGGATNQLVYDDSASTWGFQANDITTSGGLSCGTFTSTGIDDNANGERLQVADDRIIYGVSGANYGIFNAGNTNNVTFSGGNGFTDGANIQLFGGAHGTQANDVFIRAGSTNQLVYKDSASTWNFQLNQIILDQGTADNGFINFQATINADATSAISSLTTSGAVTHHIQFEINGATFWIAGSTTDPS